MTLPATEALEPEFELEAFPGLRADARRMRRLRQALVPIVVLGALVGAWQVLVTALHIGEYLLPTPWEVIQAANANASELWNGVFTTALTSVIAFFASALVGAVAGIAIAHSRALERTTMPLLILLWTAPTVAIAPVVVVWIGVGLIPVVIIAMVICFFPIVTNVVSGIRSVSESSRDLFKVYGSSRRQVLWSLEIPSTLPHLFAALKITAALAMVGTVSGEYVAGVGGGSGGLGYIIIVSGNRLQTAYLFAASIISALLGMVVYWLVGIAERLLLGSWHESVRATPS